MGCGFIKYAKKTIHGIKVADFFFRFLVLAAACHSVKCQSANNNEDDSTKLYKVTTKYGDIFGTKRISGGDGKKTYYRFLGKIILYNKNLVPQGHSCQLQFRWL